MKKLLLSLAAMALGMSAMAQDEALYTLAFSANLNETAVTGYTSSFGVKASADATTSTWTVAGFNNNGNGGGTANTTGSNKEWTYVRCGRKNTASTASIINQQAWQQSIAKVVINMNKQNLQSTESMTSAKLEVLSSANAETADATYDITDAVNALTKTAGDVTVTITAPAANKFYKIVFDCPSYKSNGAWQVNTVKYYGQAAPEKAVKTPTFSLVKTAEGYAVEMSCATEGAQIYYTTSWDEAPADPTNASQAYSAPIDVWGMTYFKAIAYKGEEFSNVASYTANPPMVVEDFSNLVGAGFEEGQEALIEYRGNATVVYQNGSNIYVTDGNTGMCLYGSNSSTYSNGDVINGITGTYTVYKGLPEIKNYTLGEVTTGGAAVQPKEVELYLVNNSMLNQYVKLVGVNIAEGTSANNYVLSNADGDEVALYNQFKINMETGENFTVTGIIGSFNKVQFMPITIEGGTVMETVATPVFEPASGELEANAEITITCATEGAAIYYTVDGTTPTADSNEYLAPIVFTKAMTVKAIAVKDGMLDSEIAEAVYTLYDPTVPVSSVEEFDFTTFKDIKVNPAVTMPETASTGVDLETDATLSKGNVTITIDNGTANNKTRIWRTTGNAYQLRPYNGSQLVFACPATYSISKIEYTIAKGTIALASGQTGSYTDKVWTAGASKISEVKFDCTANAQINGVTVTLEKSTGVEGVEVEEDAAPVYYNLQGVRVNNPERGIYIQVKGNKATKVVL